jgi:hypothetical protein
MKYLKKSLQSVSKASFLLILLFQFHLKSSAQVTEIYTDFGGYWKSTTTSISPTVPNLSHNVLAFTYAGTAYSTGVNDATLTSHSVTYTAGTYKALPISSFGGTVASANSTFILMPSDDDGVLNGTTTPYPSVRMVDVMTDGINGLDIGTGITNIPANASMSFPISSIVTTAISDAQPDILYTQIAATGGNSDSLYFVTSSGARVGNAVGLAWGSVSPLGNHTCDLYTLTNGASCDAAIITGVNSTTQSKQIRLAAFKLSDFGITSGNASTVAALKITPGGASDCAFVAYNADAFNIATPVITTDPLSQVICPGTSQNAVFTVVATGTSLTYQWRKNGVNITGATSSTYTITNVVASDAAAYDVVVTNSAGSVQSQIAYLNTTITAQPLPATQTIATGNTVTLSVTATNATGYQWKKNGTNISGATSSTLTLSPLTSANSGTFTVQAINSASSGCASILSSAAVVVPDSILYSKNTILNVPANWTINSDGSSGSAPVDFTRTEHTFIVRTNASTTGDLTIAGTLDVKNAVTTITAGTTLTAGMIIRSGTTGTLAGSSTSNLTVGSATVTGTSQLYFSAGNQLLKNLTIATGGTVTLNTGLGIAGSSTPGVLTVNSSSTFNTSDSLTLISDAGGTASVGSSAGTINGKATVQRYIPARRAWRLMTAPITSSPTIYNSWQNGGVYAAGVGTYVSGTATGNGLDRDYNPSLFTYNSSTQKFVIVNNTNVSLSAGSNGSADNTGYFIFVRGDRSASNFTPPNSNITTLSSTGKLQTGTQTFTASSVAGNFTFIGNPYASPIDFNNVTRSNLIKRFYAWDPALNTVGGFVVLDDLDGDGVFTSSVGSSPIGKDIQSSQAFFVQTMANGAASLTINESSKSSVNNNLVFRPDDGITETFRSNLFLLNADNTTVLADGNVAQYNDSYSAAVDMQDGVKFSNIDENFALLRDNIKLSIERRPLIVNNDTLFLNLTNTTQRNYQFQFIPTAMNQPGLTGYLKDSYTGDSTLLNMNGNTAVNFSIGADSVSANPNRFMIVFSHPSGIVPVTFTSVAALTDKTSIDVNWKTANEINISKYEVERSADSKQFTTMSTSASNASATYSWVDNRPLKGDNFYRIKSIDNSGKMQYSQVVKAALTITPAITLSSVSDGNIEIQMNNVPAGICYARLINADGQVIKTAMINHSASNTTEAITVGNDIAKGVYHLQIIEPNKNTAIINLAY